MKKRINILMSISIVCAAASTSAIAAMCSISNNSTKKYNEAKSRLLNLIKKLDNKVKRKQMILLQDKIKNLIVQHLKIIQTHQNLLMK
ncbi:hypothetical protein D9D13_00925 [Metamycoplasma hominis]|uniref:hypothetical protein n=1 Tax=Metamycoplasma hominis TaxID=2098 RepID=UPI000EAD381F|nr:hypothetical protein [Metamycoplasma hominis]AYK04527.1 hypothetical protein D9D13_00925 [Metamycoplasma hominis]